MHTEQQKVLDVKNLVVDYTASSGGVRAVDQVSFELCAGECVGIIGESGSGKSVSVLAIMGLHPKSTIITGDVQFDGRDLLVLCIMNGGLVATGLLLPRLRMDNRRIATLLGWGLKAHRIDGELKPG